MDPLLSLLAMWVLSRTGARAPEQGGGPPAWPTTTSPPPPMPAFAAHVPPIPAPAKPPAKPPKVRLSKGAVMVTKAVAALQALVNARGGRLKPDGLYGPKTAAAWSALARSRGVAPDIARSGPQTARVNLHAFETLNVPPIP